MIYRSFTNRGLHIFTTLGDRKAFARRRQTRVMPSPARKPKYPIPEMGI